MIGDLLPARPSYGGMSGGEMARRIAAARRLDDDTVAACLRTASRKIGALDDLDTASPAVTYYACRLLQSATPKGQLALF